MTACPFLTAPPKLEPFLAAINNQKSSMYLMDLLSYCFRGISRT